MTAKNKHTKGKDGMKELFSEGLGALRLEDVYKRQAARHGKQQNPSLCHVDRFCDKCDFGSCLCAGIPLGYRRSGLRYRAGSDQLLSFLFALSLIHI